ncbi:MAG: peptidylprolyl isomerase [Spirochaetes bacterium]|nr:peptidylprolyl isomerase [Spirochaetota bacterium]
MGNKVGQARSRDTVKVICTGKLKDGTVIQENGASEPLEFVIGAGNVIKGLERAVLGMVPGEKKTAEIAPASGYGPYREALVAEVDKGRIPNSIELKVGRKLKIRQKDGSCDIVRITDITDTAVTLDANHPFAGKDLVYDIELKAIL